MGVRWQASTITGLARKLQQQSPAGSKTARPFLSVPDPRVADGASVQQLYSQAAEVAGIAYLLFGAAYPLAHAPGSSVALLQYFNPGLLNMYAMNTDRANQATVRTLYELAVDLQGTDELKGGQYTLYAALREAFGWLVASTPTAQRPILLPDTPTTMFTYIALPLPDIEAAVAAQLSPSGALADAAAQLEALGLPPAQFAALVPRVMTAIRALHHDVDVLYGLAASMTDGHFRPGKGGGDAPQPLPADSAASSPTPTRSRRLSSSGRSLLAVYVPPTYNYTMPPGAFTPLPPSELPDLYVPLVFHVMLYKDNINGASYDVAPPDYASAPEYIDRLVTVANLMLKPSRFQFFVREVRNNPTTYPYLLQQSRAAWLLCGGGTSGVCLQNGTLINEAATNFPRVIHVFIASDSSAAARDVPLGSAYVPGWYNYAPQGYAFLTWDNISPNSYNSLNQYNGGPHTLVHELVHHLGVDHPFGPTNDENNSCNDDDQISDTPSAYGSVFSASFEAQALDYCLTIFYAKYGGNWTATYERWSTQLGIPEDDMNAWADSCPSLAGYDELGNYMTYNTAVCYAALGHLTRGQVERMHYITSEVNPVLYAWGQYYAATMPAPSSALPAVEQWEDICKTASSSYCPCKASWTFNSQTYSYCDRIDNTNTLRCEVADPASCAPCASITGTCRLSCAGKPAQCGKSSAPGTSSPLPPPPSPPSPPPAAPPPPPREYSLACKKTRANCDCLKTWYYNGKLNHYCANPDNDPNGLWCMVDYTCSTYNAAPSAMDYWAYCSGSLTNSSCAGTVASAPPPSPPRPSPPAPPPSPPVASPTPSASPSPSPSPSASSPSPSPSASSPSPSALSPSPSASSPSPSTSSPSPSVSSPSPSASSPSPSSGAPSPPPSPPSPRPPPSPPLPSPKPPSPSPPPPSPPPPTPPPPGPAATVSSMVTLSGDCQALLSSPNSTNAVKFNLTQALSSVHNVPLGQVNITSLACGSLVVQYQLIFPAGTPASQIELAVAPLSSPTVFAERAGPAFVSTYGDVQAVQRTITVSNEAILCADATKSDVCPNAPEPKKKDDFPIFIVIGAVGGVVVLLLVILVVVLALRKRNTVIPNNKY